jgi:DNA repair protein RadC
MLILVGDWTETCRGVLVRGPEDIGDALVEAFGACAQEALVALVLQRDRRVLECSLVALGHGNEAQARPVDVFRRCLQMGSRSLLLAHNHPSGRVAPSEADLAFTARTLNAAELVGLDVIDHLILGRRSWRSLRDSTRLWDADRPSRPICKKCLDP